MDCVFCKIVNKDIQTKFLYEDEQIIAFNSIDPKAPIHILIIPKKHITSINNLEKEDKELVGKIILVAKDLAKEKDISEAGYRLIFNTGKDAGQTVDHIHLHLIGGIKLPFA
ncbi:MAG: histidine triad nucleotide-binding protein [Candidatus Nealsonbacteria bacterium]